MKFKSIHDRSNEYKKIIEIIENIKKFYKTYLLTDGRLDNYSINRMLSFGVKDKESCATHDVKEVFLFLKYYTNDLLFVLRNINEIRSKYNLLYSIELRDFYNFSFIGEYKERKFHVFKNSDYIMPFPNTIYGDLLIPNMIYFKFLPINKYKNEEQYLNIILIYDIRNFFSRFRIALKAKDYGYLSFATDYFTINRELKPENIKYKWEEVLSEENVNCFLSCMQNKKKFFFPDTKREFIF
jgi:hypothetical protein